MEDLVRIFGLGHRDLTRNARQTNASDLSPRQLALSMSMCQSFVSAADLLSTGGEAAARLDVNCAGLECSMSTTLLDAIGSPLIDLCVVLACNAVELRRACWKSKANEPRSRRIVRARIASTSRLVGILFFSRAFQECTCSDKDSHQSEAKASGARWKKRLGKLFQIRGLSGTTGGSWVYVRCRGLFFYAGWIIQNLSNKRFLDGPLSLGRTLKLWEIFCRQARRGCSLHKSPAVARGADSELVGVEKYVLSGNADIDMSFSGFVSRMFLILPSLSCLI